MHLSSMVEEGTVKPASPEYPRVMKRKLNSSGLHYLVLFEDAGEGTVINPGNNGHPLGHHSVDWDMDGFEPFVGRVTIESAQ